MSPGRPGEKGSRPVCPYCGHPKRRGGKPGVEYVCRDCRRIAHAADCEPRAWRKDFDDRAAWLFITHPLSWLRLTAELDCTAADAARCVELLERRGFLFESDPHRGRRLIGWTRWPAAESRDAQRKPTERG